MTTPAPHAFSGHLVPIAASVIAAAAIWLPHLTGCWLRRLNDRPAR